MKKILFILIILQCSLRIDAAEDPTRTPTKTTSNFQKLVEEAIAKKNMYRLTKIINENINSPDGTGFRLIHVAASRNFETMIELLIERKADLNPPSPDGISPLHLAASHSEGGNGSITRLIMGGANLEAKNKAGLTPTHIACENNNIGALRALILARANLAATGNEGVTPLHIATRWNNLASMQLLLENGVPNSEPTSRLTTPLHIAVKESHNDAVRILLETGAAINSCTLDGWSPLHLAANFDAQESKGKEAKLANIFTLLLQNGADHTLTIDVDGSQVTPLEVAALQGNVQFIARLLYHRKIEHAEISRALRIAEAQKLEKLSAYLQKQLDRPHVLSLDDLEDIPPLIESPVLGQVAKMADLTLLPRGGDSGNDSDCSSSSVGSDGSWSLVSKQKP
jgi:ankyrin repeat protein